MIYVHAIDSESLDLMNKCALCIYQAEQLARQCQFPSKKERVSTNTSASSSSQIHQIETIVSSACAARAHTDCFSRAILNLLRACC
jgi:hypothetical protein